MLWGWRSGTMGWETCGPQSSSFVPDLAEVVHAIYQSVMTPGDCT